MNNPAEILKWAKEYIIAGYYIFPLHAIGKDGKCTCGTACGTDAGKHPRLSRGLKEASRDLDKIEEWFGLDSPASNIGLVTGEISGITVIDIDIGEGKFGAESWADAIKDHDEPETLMSQTGSGGMHVIFKYNSALKTASNVLGKGIDCRNDGGYIVAPPSVHRCGGKYEWLNWGDTIASLPAHLSRRKETRGRPKRNDMYRGKYTIEQIENMLSVIPSDDRDLWRHIGIILGREFNRVDEAWKIYVTWSDKNCSKKGRNHNQIMREAFYEISGQPAEKELTIGTIVKAAIDNGWSPQKGEVPICNFVYYGPGNNYIYRPTISYWIQGAVDAAVSPINDNGKLHKASEWLQLNQLCTSMTCDPSFEDDFIKGYDCKNGEIVETPGAALFNAYRRPTIELGDSKLSMPFLNHIKKVFPRPGDADQFLDYMAHRVQKPWEKPRFALLIAGMQGTGKDTAVEFCCPAIGVWNVSPIEPGELESNFNEYCEATLVRISEAANLHEMTKWAFNEKTKVLIAGSPDTVVINPKYGQKHSIRMYCGVIITTNHLSNGIYIPEDDRRYDVIDSATIDEMFLKGRDEKIAYFTELWNWFYEGGSSHIVAFLHERDITKFSANNGQRQTSAFKDVVASGYSGDHWLLDILCEMGEPIMVRLDSIIAKAVANGEAIGEIKRKIGNSLGRAGYFMYRNPETKDGRWKVEGKPITVFAKNGTAIGLCPKDYIGKELF